MRIDEKLKKEMEELKQLKEMVLKSLSKAPQGMIRCEMARGKYPQFYLISENKDERTKCPRGRFLHKEEIKLARACVQKEYDQQILKLIQKHENKISKLIGCGRVCDLKNVYEKMPLAKRSLIQPYVMSDVEYIEKWQNNVTETNGYPIDNGLITEKGELVRSKSEKMIADKLFSRGIPYIYEAKLVLHNGKTVYPDFMMLNIRTRETFYYEHFGMMDDSEYCKKALTKLKSYEENEIYLGEKLMVTFESSMMPIQMKEVDSLIDRFLL